MLLVTDLDEIPQMNAPCALTIGTFDGVHLGHQSLLNQARNQLPANGILAALTFSNHPSRLFTPDSPVPLIYPPQQKVEQLFNCGVHLVILIPFNQNFANLPFEEFLIKLKKQLGFNWLTLGEGAAFGKGKQGDATAVKEWGKKLDFSVEYLQKKSLHHHSISSGKIRSLIQQGLLSQASEYLGRPYSLMGCIEEKSGQLFCHFPGICLPPEREYEVDIQLVNGKIIHEIVVVSPQDCAIYLEKGASKNLINQKIIITF